ncbi:unnamed protein product [Linum trigynum]|uniref:Replication protein A 70 kDa DNA-binding subunit B/D first OB fold domain-containing protein n=1 Tax=Linum trigynum TaxID=586398 RepID=A0AAV2GSY9_9ROSI
MDFNGMRDLESEKQIWSGHCRVSRLWLGASVTTDKVLHLDMILMDSKGNDIWVHIPPVLQEQFKALLQEQEVYIIKDYEIHTTQLKYRPIANSYIMTFNRATTVQRVPDIPSIPAFKFSFTKASEMKDKLGQIIILSDVVGELVKHSNLLTTTNLSRKTTRKELELKLIEGDIVRVVIWGRVITEFDKIVKPVGDQPIIPVVTAVSVNLFKSQLSFSSSGSTILYPNLDIPEVKAFSTRDVQPEQPMYVELPPPAPIPELSLSELLELHVDPDSEEGVYSVTCKVVGIKPFWCYLGCPTCVLKPIERNGEYYCVKCNKMTPIRPAKYRIQLEVEANSKTGQNYEEPPADLLKVVGVTKLFHVKFKPNLYSDAQPDFTVLKILEPESTSSESNLHKDSSSSSLSSGLESSQTSSDQSIPISTADDTGSMPVDNKLKRKMPSV